MKFYATVPWMTAIMTAALLSATATAADMPPPFGGPGAGWHPGVPPGQPSGFGPPPGGPGAMIERAIKDLNLTEAQKPKVQEILKAQGAKAHEAFEKMHEDFMKSLKGVLDEEQFKKLEKDLPKPPTPGDLPGLSGKPTPPKE